MRGPALAVVALGLLVAAGGATSPPGEALGDRAVSEAKRDCVRRLATPHPADGDQRAWTLFVADALPAELRALCRQLSQGRRVTQPHLQCVPLDGQRALGPPATTIEVLRKGLGTRVAMMEGLHVEIGICTPEGPDDTLRLQYGEAEPSEESFAAADAALVPMHPYLRLRRDGPSRWDDSDPKRPRYDARGTRIPTDAPAATDDEDDVTVADVDSSSGEAFGSSRVFERGGDEV